MNQLITTPFFEQQLLESTNLAANSDILDLFPKNDDPPLGYEAVFHCRGLVHVNGRLCIAEKFTVDIRFPEHYLEQVNPLAIASFTKPPLVFHPNVLGPVICPGPVAPGTSLVSVLYQIYEVITWFRWNSADPLNPAAAQWARNHADEHEFPLDQRPLRRRKEVTQS